MNLGVCWQNEVWADGSWVEDVWCPESTCTPISIGECWTVSWCEGTWQTDTWCPTPTPEPTPTPVQVVEQRRWPGPPIVIYRETDVIPAWQRQREDEEIVIL